MTTKTIPDITAYRYPVGYDPSQYLQEPCAPIIDAEAGNEALLMVARIRRQVRALDSARKGSGYGNSCPAENI